MKHLKLTDARGCSLPRLGILVVEDEALVALETSQILTEAGFDILGPAKSVAKSLALLKRSNCDAAVLDFNLGGETSEPVARELLQAGIPFVMLSGYSRKELPPLLQGAPFVAKPLRPQTLLSELWLCLGAKECAELLHAMPA